MLPPSEGPAPPRQSAFSSLKHQQFRWLYASNIAFFFAMNGQFVVRSYLAYDLTESELALGAKSKGFSYTQLIGRIVDSAASRYGLKVKSERTTTGENLEAEPPHPSASRG